MNCQEIQDSLPLHLYGDLSPAEARDVELHLAGCDTCRRELAALAQVRQGLSATPLPAVPFASELRIPAAHTVSSRRWQIAALAGLAAAIGLLILRCEIQLDHRQLVVRWGAVPEPVREATIVVKHEAAPPTDFDERLARMSELISVLAGSVEAGDRERSAQIRGMQQELANLKQENHRRWSQTRQEVDALYTAQFGSRHSGVNP
jgi:hypothetical protein